MKKKKPDPIPSSDPDVVEVRSRRGRLWSRVCRGGWWYSVPAAGDAIPVCTVADMDEFRRQAERLIDSSSPLVLDLASEFGQMFGNVKHMSWFKAAVARELASTTKKWSRMLELFHR